MSDSETSIHRAQREVVAGEKRGRKGAPLVHLHLRILPEDHATLQEMAITHARSEGYLARVAVHILADAYRRDRRVLG